MSTVLDRTIRILPAPERPVEQTTTTAWRPQLRAALAYLAVRLVSVLVLAGMAAARGHDVLDRLTAWDGWWYLQIAEHRYNVPDVLDATGSPYPDAPMAFFPLYPGAMAVLGELGIPLVAAGIVVSTLAGIAAACALQKIGQRVGGPRAGLLLVVLWAGAPMAITQSMVYTEALFTALAAWALVGVLERNWLVAGSATMFAGFTRSTATVLIAVVVIAALIAAWRGRDRWQALTAAVAAPLGLLGYWFFVAVNTGSWTGWQDIEMRGWDTRWDWGAETAEYVFRNLVGDGGALQTLVVLMLLAAVALGVVTVTARVPWPVAAYGVGVLVLVVGTAGLPFAKPRFLLPAFALLIPIAVALAKRRPATAVAVTVAFVLAGCWYSGYALTVWKHAI